MYIYLEIKNLYFLCLIAISDRVIRTLFFLKKKNSTRVCI